MTDTFRDDAQQWSQSFDRKQELAEIRKLHPRERIRRIVDEHITSYEQVIPEMKRITCTRETLLQDLWKVLEGDLRGENQ